MADPQYPDRPDHPHFWELAQAVTDNDTLTDNGKTLEEVLDALISGGIDTKSVLYVARQRVLRSEMITGRKFDTPVAVATWIDGFAAAMRIVQNRTAQDGQHRG